MFGLNMKIRVVLKSEKNIIVANLHITVITMKIINSKKPPIFLCFDFFYKVFLLQTKFCYRIA